MSHGQLLPSQVLIGQVLTGFHDRGSLVVLITDLKYGNIHHIYIREDIKDFPLFFCKILFFELKKKAPNKCFCYIWRFVQKRITNQTQQKARSGPSGNEKNIKGRGEIREVAKLDVKTAFQCYMQIIYFVIFLIPYLFSVFLKKLSKPQPNQYST